MPSPDNYKIENLYRVLSKLNSEGDIKLFLEDLCTIREILDMADRLEGARLLSEGLKYKEISTVTGFSSATLSRINRCLQYGEGGYKKALETLEGSYSQVI